MQTKKLKTFPSSKSLWIPNMVYSEKCKALAAPSYSLSQVMICDTEKKNLIHKEILPKYSSVDKLFFLDEWLIFTWSRFTSDENLDNIFAFNVMTMSLVKFKSEGVKYYHIGNFGNCAIFSGEREDQIEQQLVFCAETGSFSVSDATADAIYLVYQNTLNASYYIACNKDGESVTTLYEYSSAYEVPTYDNVISTGRRMCVIPHGPNYKYRKKYFLAEFGNSAPPELYNYDGARVKIDLPKDYLNIVESSFRTSAIIDSDGGESYLILYHRKGTGHTLDMYYWCFRIDGEYGTLVWQHRLAASSAEMQSFFLTGAHLLHGSTLLDYPSGEDAHLAGKLHLISYDTGEVHSFDHAGEEIGGATDCLPYGNFYSQSYDSGVYFTQGKSGLSMYAIIQ